MSVSDEITDDEANRMLEAAQKLVSLATEEARAITPDSMMPTMMTIVEAAHASLLGAALLAQFGSKADQEIDEAIFVAQKHLRHFAEPFVQSGLDLIASGQMPTYLVAKEVQAP